MKLTPCPACRRLVSRTAKSCPSCGHDIEGPESRKFTLYIAIVAVLVFWAVSEQFGW